MEINVYGLSNRRELEINEKFAILRDSKSGRIVKIPSRIWFLLSRKFSKIEKALENSKNYFVHLDDGWFVSVRKPFASVSIRRFYFARNGGLNPSSQRMSFKPPEWAILTSSHAST